MNIQYKKGVIELCILAQLNKSDMYGYELSTVISKEMDISDGTVYPILRKLKQEGLVTTYLSEDSGGPARKYYSITKMGIESFKVDAKEWTDFTELVKRMIGDEMK
ncbi:MAG: PadR family transcriptional regulator [Candidatus Izemoplasmatales bacterium]